MSGLVFVCDADQRPLMPMAAAYARRLLGTGRARRRPHHAFTILQLTHTILDPEIRPITLRVDIHFNTAELVLIAEGDRRSFRLARFIIDLRTDLPWRLRRRAGFRRRRRARGRYRAASPYGQSFKLRTPSLWRSRWATVHRRGRQQSVGKVHIPAIIQWRAEAIERVIMALQKYVPVSHVLITPTPAESAHDEASPLDLRRRLIAAYGRPSANGSQKAVCCYCGSSDDHIEVDHVVPRSRGGTDRWENLVLTCLICNKRKGERIPEEAGMKLRIHLKPEPIQFSRARPYVTQTIRQLAARLQQGAMKVSWRKPDGEGSLLASSERDDIPCFVAYPVARPRKQIFTGRNYPLTTTVSPAYVQVGTTVKRRVRVNLGIARWHNGRSVIANVIPVGTHIPPKTEQFFRVGMLCQAQRAQSEIIGVVTAIHSAGRLTLARPTTASPKSVQWERVVVSPRGETRMISTDRVLFFAVKVEVARGESV